jgi:Na+-transporting NADH:ubiquinone oxidoreductase subunit NqrF
MLEISLGVALFTAIVLVLVGIILLARARLVATGTVNITLNGEKNLPVPVGLKLLNALADARIFVPSACGGGGTCGQCRVKVRSGVGLWWGRHLRTVPCQGPCGRRRHPAHRDHPYHPARSRRG